MLMVIGLKRPVCAHYTVRLGHSSRRERRCLKHVELRREAGPYSEVLRMNLTVPAADLIGSAKGKCSTSGRDRFEPGT